MSSEKMRLFIFLMIAFAGCKTAFDNPNYSAGEADFSRYVALGGSYTAGFTDNALYLEGQQNSFPSILASRFKLVGGGNFEQPLVNAGNGLGNKYILNYGSACNNANSYYLTSLPEDPSNRSWIGYKAPYNNLGVPVAKSFHLNDQYFGRSNATPYSYYYNRFATDTGFGGSGLTSTILGDAGKVSDGNGSGPTFFSLWIGLNDYLGYALTGGEGDSITPENLFNTAIDTILTSLTSYSGKGIVTNLPDINSLPFFTTIPYTGLNLTQAEADSLNIVTADTIHFVEGANSFWIKSPLPSDLTRKIQPGELVLYSIIDSIRCRNINERWGTPQNPIPSKYILDINEANKIANAVNVFNAKLQSSALSKSLAFVDMNSYFRTLQSGIIFNGVNYTSQYLNGGAFSLDGIHPNPRGYALIANEFIRVINAKYKSTIPEVDVNNYPGIRFP